MTTELQILKEEIEKAFGIKNMLKNREDQYKIARAVFVKIGMGRLNYSLTEISKCLQLTHAAVINSRNNFYAYMAKYPEYERIYEGLITGISNRVDDAQKNRILALEKKVEALTHKKYKPRHKVLFDLVNEVPDYHVETMELWLKPKIRMLEKPCRFNRHRLQTA